MIQPHPTLHGRVARTLSLAPLLAISLLAACDDEDPNTSEERGNASAASALYVMTNEVFNADNSTTYVNLLPSLEIESVDSDKAREYTGGRATIGTIGGYLFVASPEAPVVTRFEVEDDGSLTEAGTLSFANYEIDVALDDWGNTFVSETKSYLWSGTDGRVIVWNPSTLTIEAEIVSDKIEFVRDGLEINSSAGVLRGDRLFRTISWTNWEEYSFSDEQYLAVYDTENDTLLDVVEERRCPALSNRVERDEAGNLYFSNWIWNVTSTLTAAAPKSCALRIAPDAERFDPDWSLQYADVTEGREAAMFAYLGDGRASLSVFHDERERFDAKTDPQELASSVNWRLWNIDLSGGTGAPIEGLDYNSGAISTYHLDDRAFILVPGEDWSVTHVLELVENAAVPRFDLRGWSYQLLKIR